MNEYAASFQRARNNMYRGSISQRDNGNGRATVFKVSRAETWWYSGTHTHTYVCMHWKKLKRSRDSRNVATIRQIIYRVRLPAEPILFRNRLNLRRRLFLVLGRGQAVESIFGRIGRIGFKEKHLVRIYIYKLYDIVDFYNIFINGFTNFMFIVRIVKRKKSYSNLYKQGFRILPIHNSLKRFILDALTSHSATFYPRILKSSIRPNSSVPSIKASPTTDICQFAVPKITTKILAETKLDNECDPPTRHHAEPQNPSPEHDTML